MKISTDKIRPNPNQPRSKADPEALKSLAQSIKDHGLINPIAVEGPDDDGMYTLIDGERRWRAHQLAEILEIECSIRQPMDGSGDQERLALATIANLQREDMNPVDQARAYRDLQELGLSQSKIGEKVGMSTSSVSMYLRILGLPEKTQELYAAGKLPLSSRVITMLKTLPNEKCDSLALKFARHGTSIRYILTTCKRALDQQEIELQTRAKPKPKEETIFTGTRPPLVEISEHYGRNEFVTAADAVCRRCALFDIASSEACKGCPAIDLVEILMEKEEK